MEAFDLVSQRRPSASLTIAGAPSPAELDPDEVRRWAGGHGDRVTLIDRYVPVEDVRELFSRARVVAAPYLAGGYQSGVVRLAMSMARPVVASDIGELPEMVADDETGRTVPSGDSAALAGALEALVADFDQACRLGAAARSRVLSESNAEVVAAEIESALRSLVERAPPGAYAAQTYASPHFLVRYSHGQRFRRAAELVSARRPRSVLDYGAGDCQFLLELRPPRAVAYNPPDEVMDVRRRLREHDADFVRYCQDIGELEGERFDVITCLSVLEHLPLPERERFYELCKRVLVPGGCCVVEVPVEIGPSLLVKDWVRRRQKGRRREYTRGELARLAVGRSPVDPGRHDPDARDTYIETHKGFDYRLLRRELERHFEVRASFPTPLRWLPPWLGNQEVFFVLENRSVPPDPDTDPA